MKQKSKPRRPTTSGQPVHILEEHLLVAHLNGEGLRAMGQGSNFQAMCHRLALFGPMRPCRACGGHTHPEPRAGSGYVPIQSEAFRAQREAQEARSEEQGVDYHDGEYWTIDAMRFELMNAKPKTETRNGIISDLASKVPRYELVNDLVEPCEPCQALGWLPASGWYPSAGWPEADDVTACPTSLRREAGALLDDTAIEMSGRVARWLYALARADEEAALAILALWGPDNQRGRKSPFLDVWPLTDAGAKLGRSVEGLEELRHTIALMTVPHPQRNLVMQAEEQAAALVERACAAWDAVVCGVEPERPSEPPPAEAEAEGGDRAAA